MLLVLLGLGTWQVYRLHWKEGILARIAAAEAAPPSPLAGDPAPYTRVSATGRFRFDLAVGFGADVRDAAAGPTMGFYQIVPLERDGGQTVLVDRGWVPQKPETAVDDPSGVVSVIGYVRPRETQHWFSPADDAAARQFYTLDPAAIGAAVGVQGPAPFTLVALSSATPGPATLRPRPLGPAAAASYPAPARHLPQPPNNHLSYVITWYGLAVALVVIFGVWIRKVPRS